MQQNAAGRNNIFRSTTLALATPVAAGHYESVVKRVMTFCCTHG
jgi:hypothetical protein